MAKKNQKSDPVVADANEIKIVCPHCGGSECFESQYKEKQSYLCIDCGYTSNSDFVVGSDIIAEVEQNTAQIIKDLKFEDTDRNLYWYPAVIQLPGKGIIAPEGSPEEWMWISIPISAIPEDELINYPVEGHPGKYYETRLDIESKATHLTFLEACDEMGVLIRR